MATTSRLEVFIEQCDSDDFNDSEEVNGWLRGILTGDILTIEHEDSEGVPIATEKYRVTRIDDDAER